jgi:hypothetical protein
VCHRRSDSLYFDAASARQRCPVNRIGRQIADLPRRSSITMAKTRFRVALVIEIGHEDVTLFVALSCRYTI